MGHVWSKQSAISKNRSKHASRKHLEDVYVKFRIQRKSENISRLQFYKHVRTNGVVAA